MAVRRKRTVKKLKFELTRSAVAGIAVVVSCLFLWIFLLGVWAGQSLLLPAPKQEVAVVGNQEATAEPMVIRAVKKAVKTMR